VTDLYDDWAEALAKLRQRLVQILRDPADAQANAADAIEDLDHLDRLFRQRRPVRRRQGEARTDRPPNEYRIEAGKRGPCLGEYFAEDRPPFKCERRVYDGIAAALEGFSKPASVEELVRAARKTTRDDLPEYLVRQCLRFWLSREPALVEKVGTRYQPLDDLPGGAKRVWAGLHNAGVMRAGV